MSDPQWKTTWEEVYTAKSLTSVPWYAILGNHDYHQNPQAEVDFQNGTQWHMPARWYTKSFQTPDGASVDFVFIDTVNLAGTHTTVKYEELYAEGRITDDMLARWREYVDSGRQAADAQSQLDWIKATLAASTADWLCKLAGALWRCGLSMSFSHECARLSQSSAVTTPFTQPESTATRSCSMWSCCP